MRTKVEVLLDTSTVEELIKVLPAIKVKTILSNAAYIDLLVELDMAISYHNLIERKRRIECERN